MSEPHSTEAAAGAAATRKAWTKPTLATLASGAAELNIGVADDGSDLS